MQILFARKNLLRMGLQLFSEEFFCIFVRLPVVAILLVHSNRLRIFRTSVPLCGN